MRQSLWKLFHPTQNQSALLFYILHFWLLQSAFLYNTLGCRREFQTCWGLFPPTLCHVAPEPPAPQAQLFQGTPSNPPGVALGADFSSLLAAPPTESHYQSSFKLLHWALQHIQGCSAGLLARIIRLQHKSESQPQAQSSSTASQSTSQSTEAMAGCVLDTYVPMPAQSASRKAQQRNAGVSSS